MAGLNSLVSDTTTQVTSLPSWYDTAQQNLTSQAQTAAATVPTAAQTPVGAIAAQMGSGQSPFAQGQTTLNQIATGAANPWIVSGGNVTPNVNTPLGGLFAAQNKQLQQLAPNIMAPSVASGVGTGQFGSLRAQTAADKALTDAQANLFASQMQNALQSQQTGAAAASGLGTLGQQQGQTGIGIGTFQQNAPMAGLTDLANIINAERTGSTVSKSSQYSPLSLATGLLTALGGRGQFGTGGLLNTLLGSNASDLLGKGGLLGLLGAGGAGLYNMLTGGGGGTGSTGQGAGSYETYDENGNRTGYMQINSDGTQTQYNDDGSITAYDNKGNVIQDFPAGTSGDIQNQIEQQQIQDASGQTPAYDALVASGEQ